MSRRDEERDPTPDTPPPSKRVTKKGRPGKWSQSAKTVGSVLLTLGMVLIFRRGR